MRLEKKRDRELARRKGLARRTVALVLWLIISGVIAYFAVRYLFETQLLDYNYFYFVLGLPAWVPRWAITAVLVLFTGSLMQFFFIFGYTITRPEGRRRSGKPTTHTTNPDPFENDYWR